MIAYVEGQIAHKNPAYIVLDVQGVGYQVHISLHTYEQVANKERCRLLTHQVIREDAHQLYGFFEEDERELFRNLITISGIGPNTARMMLSSLSPEELKRAIIRGDVSLIKTIKGIGPKSAQRVIVELQDVLKKSSSGDFPLMTEKNKLADEALAAMATLGFSRPLAEKAIHKILQSNAGNITIEELIKQALKSI